MMLHQGYLEYMVVASGGILLCYQWIQFGDDLVLILGFLVIYLIYLFALFILQEGLCETSLEKYLNWNLRANADHGLWCILLLPLSLYTGCHQLSKYCTSTYKTITVLAFNTLLTSLCVFCYCLVKCRSTMSPSLSKKIILTSHFMSFCTCVLFIYSQRIIGICWCIILSFLSTSVFYYCSYAIPKIFPKSCTLGEALVIAQGIMLFSSATLMNSANKIGLYCFIKTSGIQSQESSVIQVALLSCGAVFLLLAAIPLLRTSLGFYLCTGGVALYVSLPWLYGMLGINPFLWFHKYLFQSESRVALICLWLMITAITALFIILQLSNYCNYKLSSTINRKFFHIIIIMVYIPGLLWDPDFLYLASGLTLCLFLMFECMRIVKVEPFGPVLQNVFNLFTEEKDQGLLVVSHISLLVGASLPFWIFPGRTDTEIYITWFCGILATGIGDMAASIGGTYFGKHHWPGSHKTLEGTFFCIVSQSLCASFLFLLGVPFKGNWVKLLISFVLTSMLEAVTLQIDNLILPFFLYQFLSVV